MQFISCPFWGQINILTGCTDLTNKVTEKYHKTCPCLSHTSLCQALHWRHATRHGVWVQTTNTSANSYLVTVAASWPSGRNSVTRWWWHSWPWIVCSIYFGSGKENPLIYFDQEALIRKPAKTSLLSNRQAWTPSPGNPHMPASSKPRNRFQ